MSPWITRVGRSIFARSGREVLADQGLERGDRHRNRRGQQLFGEPVLHGRGRLRREERRLVVHHPSRKIDRPLAHGRLVIGHGRAVGIVGGLHHVRRHGRHQGRLTDLRRPVARQVADHLGPAHRVADQRHVFQSQGVDHCGQVVGQGVHVIAAARRVRSPVPSPVEGDAAEAAIGQVGDLVGPHLAGERPARGENHRLALAPIAEEQLRAVLRVNPHRVAATGGGGPGGADGAHRSGGEARDEDVATVHGWVSRVAGR